MLERESIAPLGIVHGNGGVRVMIVECNQFIRHPFAPFGQNTCESAGSLFLSLSYPTFPTHSQTVLRHLDKYGQAISIRIGTCFNEQSCTDLSYERSARAPFSTSVSPFPMNYR